MSTPTDGTKITLLDGEHTLRFGNSALMRLEREMGGWEGFGDLPLSHVIVGLWAGLYHEDPKRTVDEVADLIDLKNDYLNIAQIVSEAIAAAMPEGDKEQGKAKRAKGAKRGKASG